MLDAHAHLTFEAFDKDREEVIDRAFKAGVTKIITVGTQISSSKDALALAEKYDGIFAAVGVHPHHADKLEKNNNWIGELEDLAKNPKVVAIGECGLDNYAYHSNGIVDMQLQIPVFAEQIKLANKLNLPLQIHNRQASTQIRDVLNKHKHLLNSPPGLLHCFAGDIDFLNEMLDLGFYIGFDGNVTYKNIAKGETVHLHDVLKATPLDRIITETDCPYLSPEPLRGQRNEPKNDIITGRFIANIKGISPEELFTQVDKNAQKLFGI